MMTEPIEDRLKDALESHAETFTASPDAWQRMAARAARSAGARTGWLARHSAFVIPAAAAAVVLAVTLGAVTLARGITSTARPAVRTSTAKPAPGPSAPNPLLPEYPPISPFVTFGDAPRVTTTLWVADVSPLYWQSRPAAGPQLCHLTSTQDYGGGGGCWPLPATSAATPAVVLSYDDHLPGIRSGNRKVASVRPVLSGVAEPAAASVTAQLPDGQRIRGKITAIGGFPVKVWAVDGSLPKGTTLVFAGASGQLLTQIAATAPQGPAVLDLPQPAHGGVTLFHYPANGTLRPGVLLGYLIDGHVVFFTSGTTEAIPFAGAVSPHAAIAAPAAGGLAMYFKLVCGPVCRDTDVKAFGYAHANVAKVVVRLPGGGQVAADTFRAGWPGSDLRLWQVSLPDSVWPQNGAEPTLIATAYDAAGHAIGQAQLGQPDT